MAAPIGSIASRVPPRKPAALPCPSSPAPAPGPGLPDGVGDVTGVPEIGVPLSYGDGVVVVVSTDGELLGVSVG